MALIDKLPPLSYSVTVNFSGRWLTPTAYLVSLLAIAFLVPLNSTSQDCTSPLINPSRHFTPQSRSLGTKRSRLPPTTLTSYPATGSIVSFSLPPLAVCATLGCSALGTQSLPTTQSSLGPSRALVLLAGGPSHRAFHTTGPVSILAIYPRSISRSTRRIVSSGPQVQWLPTSFAPTRIWF